MRITVHSNMERVACSLGKHHSVLLLLTIMVLSLLSILPSGIGQASLTTVTSTSTLTSQVSANATSFSTTITSVITSTTSLLVNQTVSSYSTYNSTSTITSASSTVASAPSMDTTFLLLVALTVLAAVFLIFAIIRYVKHRRK